MTTKETIAKLEANKKNTNTNTKELTTAQKINIKIKELKKLSSIDKQIATFQAKIQKLETEKIELEKKYGL